ncbi:MAG: hypothetical protein PF569_09865 [Candidatus Woesearchaeota archaeon]|jgi:ABC-type Fe3+-siderophore transport system permease subunit|nr:hypothetical protein [Candidatus Woesearchaeota archaeon]
MGNNENSGIAFLGLMGLVAVVFILYFMSHLLFAIGIGAIIIGLIVIIFGFGSESFELGTLGVFILLGGIMFSFIGGAGINFFDHNPTGQALLDTSNTVVDVTKDSYVQISEMQGEIQKTVTDSAKNSNNINQK